ncbi:hypothetical protein ACP275_14G111300 [Erythranthe tilingii]
MAKIRAHFVSFLLVAIMLNPDTYNVESRLLPLKKSDSQSEEAMQPFKSVPSPGIGHQLINLENNLVSIDKSGPSPGEGHPIINSSDKKIGSVDKSGPSRGEGHPIINSFDKKMGSVDKSGPSPGEGHPIINSFDKKMGSVDKSGPSPGEGHKHVPVQLVYKNKP